MSAGLFDRIMDEATYNRNLLTQAYAGDLADLLMELQERAEWAEAALAAVPWQTLLNISNALEASDAVADPDEAALLTFLNRYAPWVPT